MKEITRENIKDLLKEAEEARDLKLAQICRDALAGATDAREICEDAIAAAQAMVDEAKNAHS